MNTCHLYAVFGNPVLHSRSPQIFNNAFLSTEYNAFYTRVRVNNAHDIAPLIIRLGISGANITTPFKESIIPHLHSISEEARIIGSVNTVVNRDGILCGYNTDHKGVTGSLSEAGINPSGMNCLVLGTGGAGMAAVFGLVNGGARVTIAGRNHKKTNRIASAFGCLASDINTASASLSEFGLIVSALLPDALPIEGMRLPKDIVILDANYRESRISRLAGSSGSRLINGSRWLLHQAAESYRVFTGTDPDMAAMESGYAIILNHKYLNIQSLSKENNGISISPECDMIIYSDNFDPSEQTKIINEEKNKALCC